MPSIPKLNSCCCGCTLRTGTLILLYLSLISSLLTPFSKVPETTDAQGHRQPKQEYPLGVKVASAVIGIIASVAGLYGVYTERHGFLIPYLVLDAIMVIGLIITGILTLVINVLLGIIYFLFVLPVIYFWLVVYNHYVEIKEGKGGASSA